jgi:hypothetical protein
MKMLDNYYFQSAKADFHRDRLLEEAEKDRLARTQQSVNAEQPHVMHRLGDFLIASGTRIKEQYQSSEEIQPVLRRATK